MTFGNGQPVMADNQLYEINPVTFRVRDIYDPLVNIIDSTAEFATDVITYAGYASGGAGIAYGAYRGLGSAYRFAQTGPVRDRIIVGGAMRIMSKNPFVDDVIREGAGVTRHGLPQKTNIEITQEIREQAIKDATRINRVE